MNEAEENGKKRNPFKVALGLLKVDTAGAEIETKDNCIDEVIESIPNETLVAKEKDAVNAVIVSKKTVISNATKNCCEYAKEVIGIVSNQFEKEELLHFHLDDCHNIHDEYGRIHVGGNYVDSEIQSWLKPHQIGGIRFMFDNIIAGSGCILAHEMGLGKSVQIICLCDVLLKYTEEKQRLCVV